MLICPLCQTTFPHGELSHCERDGARLLLQDDRCGSVVGNYRLLGLLGRGGMGVVYRGSHIYIDKPVAVKILHERFVRHEEAVQRFLREARAATLISHPNIVDVTDFGVLPEGGVFFVMEFLEGSSLDSMIGERGSLPLLRAINIVHQMAMALGAAHRKGIIHRDLKPENVMVLPRPGRREVVYRAPQTGDFVVEHERTFDFVKVLDFGVAKVHEIDDPSGSGTMAGTIFGTPQYISPEQARAAHVDHRADIYAIGIVFFEMLTGQVPFDGESAVEVLARQIQEAPPTPSSVAPPAAEITPAAERLIMRCLDKDPGRRPQTMAEFCLALQTCFGEVRYRRHAHLMHGASAAGVEPRRWSQPLPERTGESRLAARRLTEELKDLFQPAPPAGDGAAPPPDAVVPGDDRATLEEPRPEARPRGRLTNELQALFTPGTGTPDAGVGNAAPGGDDTAAQRTDDTAVGHRRAPRSKRLTDELQALFHPSDEGDAPTAAEADTEEVVVEPIPAIPADELSSRSRSPYSDHHGAASASHEAGDAPSTYEAGAPSHYPDEGPLSSTYNEAVEAGAGYFYERESPSRAEALDEAPVVDLRRPGARGEPARHEATRQRDAARPPTGDSGPPAIDSLSPTLPGFLSPGTPKLPPDSAASEERRPPPRPTTPASTPHPRAESATPHRRVGGTTLAGHPVEKPPTAAAPRSSSASTEGEPGRGAAEGAEPAAAAPRADEEPGALPPDGAGQPMSPSHSATPGPLSSADADLTGQGPDDDLSASPRVTRSRGLLSIPRRGGGRR